MVNSHAALIRCVAVFRSNNAPRHASVNGQEIAIMSSVQPCPLPEDALLAVYQGGGAFTDSYSTLLDGDVAFADYVSTFYSTPLFRLERLILRWAVRRPSSDAEAAALGAGTRDSFAAWTVEQRRDDQLLLRDLTGRTRSWLMARPLQIDGRSATRLFFGSAVVPRIDAQTGSASLGWNFNALLGFHRIYSRALLRAARRKLAARRA